LLPDSAQRSAKTVGCDKNMQQLAAIRRSANTSRASH
jgi:hypothetical protein